MSCHIYRTMKNQRKNRINHIYEYVYDCYDMIDPVEQSDITICADHVHVPTDVLRKIYIDYMSIRNLEKKREAAKKTAFDIAESVGRVCASEDVSYRFETKYLGKCSVNIKKEGRETKIAMIVFDTGRSFRMYILKDDTGEFKIKCVSMRNDGDEFFTMVGSQLAASFDSLHILVDRRRPSISWLKYMMDKMSLEDIAKITGASIYRLRRILS